MVESPQKSYTSSRALWKPEIHGSWRSTRRVRDTQSVAKLSLTNFKVLKKKTAEKLIWAQGRQWRNLHFQTHRKKVKRSLRFKFLKSSSLLRVVWLGPTTWPQSTQLAIKKKNKLIKDQIISDNKITCRRRRARLQRSSPFSLLYVCVVCRINFSR